ncbi:MAG: hypothetical protein KDK08_09780 [Rhizobiaceae bacterium]|nr:hypothetical protein [Rhizobiaceae bacterium]
MTNIFGTPEKKGMKRTLFSIAVEALEKDGWKVERVPGSGKSSVRRITKDAESKIISIRTSQDTWIAFPRTEDDAGWGTLDDVDAVVPVSVDDPEEPRYAQVHLIDGDEVRARLDRAYQARREAGHSLQNGRGIWISLYFQEADEPKNRVGAGVGLKFPPFAKVPLSSGPREPIARVQAEPSVTPTPSSASASDGPLTIAEAKRRLALTFGVDPESIKITVEG